MCMYLYIMYVYADMMYVCKRVYEIHVEMRYISMYVGSNHYHHLYCFTVCLRYRMLWLYQGDGTIVLVTVEAPRV